MIPPKHQSFIDHLVAELLDDIMAQTVAMTVELFTYGEVTLDWRWGDEAPDMHHAIEDCVHQYPQYKHDTEDERVAAAIESHKWFERNYH